jgi:hypothetical protein
MPFVVGPTIGHTHTVIKLHGGDSEAQEFDSGFLECEATETKQTLSALFLARRWIFPQAESLRSEYFNIKMS